MDRMDVLGSRVLLHPTELARSLNWYDEVLGLQRAREFGGGGRITGVVYFLGGGFLEVSAPRRPDAGPLGEGVDLWLQVPDVDAEHHRVAALGAEVLAPPQTMPWGLRECWVADPDGLRICLVQVPEDHPLRRRY